MILLLTGDDGDDELEDETKRNFYLSYDEIFYNEIKMNFKIFLLLFA